MDDGGPRPDFRLRFLEGIRHFNAAEFWDAHESWEALWLVAGSDLEQFLQGLIQIAAAYHHVKRGTLRGGVRLFDAGLRRLAAFPAGCCGVDRGAVERAALADREWAARVVAGEVGLARERAFPKLIVVDETQMPPYAGW
jgi:predicted metal-dependent hydrolase